MDEADKINDLFHFYLIFNGKFCEIIKPLSVPNFMF